MNLNIEIETYEEGRKHMVFLAHNGSSGCRYDYRTQKELKEIILEYVEEAVDYELEEDEDEE